MVKRNFERVAKPHDPLTAIVAVAGLAQLAPAPLTLWPLTLAANQSRHYFAWVTVLRSVRVESLTDNKVAVHVRQVAKLTAGGQVGEQIARRPNR